MPRRHGFRPWLDVLEDRHCPSLLISVAGSNLVISGTPTAALTITGAGGTTCTIMDGSHSYGTYAISNLTLNLQQYTAPITIDLKGQTLGGNVLLSVGQGNVSGASEPILIEAGTVGGSVTLAGGTGNENLRLGAPVGAANTLHVGGSVHFVGHNGFAGNNNELDLNAGSSVGGSLSTTLVSTVEIGEASSGSQVGRGLSVNDYGALFPLTLEINGTSTVSGGASVTGTSISSGGTGDRFIVGHAATIIGNTTANLGDGINVWELGGTFDGSVNLGGGGGVEPGGGTALNTIELDDGNPLDTGTFNGNLSATTGIGSTVLLFESGTTVNGNLNLNFGNGNNDLGGGPFGGVFQGSVFGNITINLGNGNNTASIGNAPIGGRFNWTSGNGNDSLTLDPTNGGTIAPVTQTWNVNFHFGNGDDSLTLVDTTPVPEYLTGLVDMGGRITANTFVQGPSWVLLSPFELRNVP